LKGEGKNQDEGPQGQNDGTTPDKGKASGQQDSPGGSSSKQDPRGAQNGQSGNKSDDNKSDSKGEEGAGRLRLNGKNGTGSTQGGQGGQPGGGTAPTVPDKPEDPDRPIERPATPPANPASPPPSAGRVDRLMDDLDRELRGGTVDPSLLSDLGWTLQQAQQFLQAYKRAKAAGQGQSHQTQLPQQVQPAEAAPKSSNQVSRSEGAAPTARTLNTTHERAPDRTRELMEVGHQRVAPRYRPLLEGYYRSVGSRPAP
jgi:hypothetical protein